MPYKAEFKVSIQDGDVKVGFSYECWSNQNTQEGLVNVQGHTEDDDYYLINHRTEVADMIKQEEGLKHLRYFESEKNGRHTAHQVHQDEHGRVTDVQNLHSPLSTEQLQDQGKQLINQEHQHNMDIHSHGLGEQAQQFRPSPGKGPGK